MSMTSDTTFANALPAAHRRTGRHMASAGWWLAALCLAVAFLMLDAALCGSRAQTAAAPQAAAGLEDQCLPTSAPRRHRPVTPFMRKHRLVKSLAPCEPCPPLPRMTLREALAKNLVDIVPCGDGVSSGYAMFMAVKSRVCNALDLDPNINMVMIRSSYDYQDMWAFRAAGEYDSRIDPNLALAEQCTGHAQVEQDLIKAGQSVSHHWRKIDRIQLAGYDPKLMLILAYCLQYKRLIPTADVTFAPSAREWTPETTQLFNYLAQHPNDYSPTVVQLALWAAGEDYSAEQIASTFKFTEQDHRDACTLIGAAGIVTSKLALCPTA
jgi:hypothetical protein